MANRNQFTFYSSFWDSISLLPPDDQLSILCAVIQYALNETEPENLLPHCHGIFSLIRPVLDSGRRRAEAGSRGGSQRAANTKQKSKATNAEPNTAEQKTIKVSNASDGAKQMLLDALWDAYPVHRRQNRDQAVNAWEQLTSDQQQAAVENLDAWINCKQWQQDNGEYIPNICNYLDPNKKYITNPPVCVPRYHPGYLSPKNY